MQALAHRTLPGNATRISEPNHLGIECVILSQIPGNTMKQPVEFVRGGGGAGGI